MCVLFAKQQFQFRGAVHAAARQARQIDIRARCLPGHPKLPIHHRNMRVPHVHRAELCEPRIAFIAVAPRGSRQARQQFGERRRLARWLIDVAGVAEIAEIQLERAVGLAIDRQLQLIDGDRTQHNPAQQQLIQRQRHVRARDRHLPAASLVHHHDVRDAEFQRTIDTVVESLPGQRDRSDRQLCGAAVGIGSCHQPPGQPRQVDRLLRQPPGDCRQTDAEQHRECNGQRRQPMQQHGAAQRDLTGEPPHAQPSGT